MIIISPIIRLILKIASIILFIVTILSSYGGICNPEFITFPSVLVLALPYLAIATLVTGLAWLLDRSVIMAAAAGITLMVSWGSLKEVSPINFPHEPSEGSRTFKLITFNCLHFADTTRSDLPGNRAIKFLAESDADIVCLQEMVNLEDPAEIHHWSRPLIDSLYAAFPYRAGSRSNDLKVLSKYPVEMVEPKSLGGGDTEYTCYGSRWNLFEVNIGGFRLPLVNFHMHSYELTDGEREVVTEIKGVRSAKKSYSEFRYEIFPKLGAAFRARAKGVRELAEATQRINPIIACGDFNDVPASWSYRLMRDAEFKDAYADTGLGPINTFNQFLLLFHIDQVFYRGAQLKPISVKRIKLDTSDHYPLEAVFEITL